MYLQLLELAERPISKETDFATIITIMQHALGMVEIAAV